MLTLRLGQAKDGSASVALTVDVCFTVAEFIPAKLEKAAEAIVFAAARRDVT